MPQPAYLFWLYTHGMGRCHTLDPLVPKTVYRTRNPELGVSECYEICIHSVPGTPDKNRCWIVREQHDYFEEAANTYHHDVETLHPSDRHQFMTFEEAKKAAGARVMGRAREGFRFLFTTTFHGVVVVLPALK